MREPVNLYRVLRTSGVRGKLNVAAGRLTPFVGRTAELAALVDRWERARDAEGHSVLIVGEAGVGKSWLAYQLRERLGAVPHSWLGCNATPYTEGTPFHPVIALVSQALAFTPKDNAATKLEKISRRLSAPASTENVALMAEFLDLRDATPLVMSPELKRHKTVELLIAWYLSEVRPLVLLIEDLHRLQGEILVATGGSPSEAETFFRDTIEIAQARPARELLAPIYS